MMVSAVRRRASSRLSVKRRYSALEKMEGIEKKSYRGGTGSGISAEEWTFSR